MERAQNTVYLITKRGCNGDKAKCERGDAGIVYDANKKTVMRIDELSGGWIEEMWIRLGK